MSRYIDAEDFFDVFPEIDKIPYSSWAVTHVADVRPVIRGKWIDGMPYVNSHWKVCSVCHKSAHRSCGGDNFCPNCGSYNGGDTE